MPARGNSKFENCPVNIGSKSHFLKIIILQTVGRLASELPNLVASHRVSCDKFSHTDFLYAKDVDKLLYQQVIDLLKSS